MENEEEVAKTFGNRLRVRVCGILLQNEKVLMAKHKMDGKDAVFWAPPGGGLEYGESTEDALKREFIEETGLEIEIKRFLCTHEFLAPPLHGIELFFLVEKVSGELITGKDPEMGNRQILEKLDFLSFPEIVNKPAGTVHQLFSHCKSLSDLENLTGLLQYVSLKLE